MIIDKIVLATRNKDKIKEISKILADLNVKILTLSDFEDIPEIEEDGSTLEQNALKKAMGVAEFSGISALADDSGLEVEALDGAPGVYSSRFAGKGCTYKDNNLKLLKSMEGVTNRKAKFRTVIAFVPKNGGSEMTEGVIEGIIADEIRGENGFGYDPVFLVPKYSKTFAELEPDVKNSISHRAMALLNMKDVLKKYIGQ